jgi:Flp pilus assembly protein TadD
VQTLIGLLFESQNKVEEARKRYEKALSLDSTAPIAANNLAWLMAEHGGNLDVALQLAQTAKAKLPDAPEVSDTLGWVYYKKELFDQAVTALAESTAKRPDVAMYHYHLGLSLAKKGDGSRARDSLTTALKLDSKAAQADEARGVLARLSP